MKDDRLYIVHILIHRYETVDLEEIWRIVEQDLPELRHSAQMILEELSAPGPMPND